MKDVRCQDTRSHWRGVAGDSIVALQPRWISPATNLQRHCLASTPWLAVAGFVALLLRLLHTHPRSGKPPLRCLDEWPAAAGKAPGRWPYCLLS